MKILNRLSVAVFVAGLIIVFNFPQPVDLVKISGKGEAVWEALQSLRIAVVQELETCYIARMERGRLQVFEEKKIPYELLDRDVSGKEYSLVHVPTLGAKTFVELQGIGEAVEVEEGTLVVWSVKGDTASLLPAHLEHKPLSSSSLLPYLRPPRRVEPPRERLRPKGDNEVIKQILSEVSTVNLRWSVQMLQDFITRYASTQECENAGEFIFEYFKSLGLPVYYQTFSFRNQHTSRNVVAEVRGSTYPEEVLIICAHYDSSSKIPQVLAPGADDDASGTAAVMEAARILARYPLDFTVRFVAFSAEEWGLYGSRAYAAGAVLRGERIIGVINMDMIAFADRMPEDLEVFVNSSSEWLAEKLIIASEAYCPLDIRKTVNASFVYSDHAAFWEMGYDALCGIEDYPLRNIFYHTVHDTLDTLDMTFFEASTKACLAALSELAQPLRPGWPKTPTGFQGSSTIISSLFHSIQDVTLSWNPSPDALSYNIYRSNLPHLYHQRINTSPVVGAAFIDRALDVDRPYYYVITAVGSGGLESNCSKEVAILTQGQEQFSQHDGRTLVFFRGMTR